MEIAELVQYRLDKLFIFLIEKIHKGRRGNTILAAETILGSSKQEELILQTNDSLQR